MPISIATIALFSVEIQYKTNWLVESSPFFFFKHSLMTGAIFLLLVILSFLGCYCCPTPISSTCVALLVLVLSTSFSFVFSKIKHLQEGGSVGDEASEESKESQDEGQKFPTNGLVPGSMGSQVWSDFNGPLPENECSLLVDSTVANEKLLPQNVGLVPSASSDSSVSDDDESSPEIACRSTGSSEGSISDDDSLIEITLNDFAPCQLRAYKRGFLPDFIPESLLGQQGLMELLSEIYEEDNLIEIDIAMGSIKCSRFEIKA